MGRKLTREPLVLTEKEQKKLIRVMNRKIKNKLDKKKNYISRILLHYSQGWSVAEVAKKSGVSEPTAYRYIDEALAEQKDSQISSSTETYIDNTQLVNPGRINHNNLTVVNEMIEIVDQYHKIKSNDKNASYTADLNSVGPDWKLRIGMPQDKKSFIPASLIRGKPMRQMPAPEPEKKELEILESIVKEREQLEVDSRRDFKRSIILICTGIFALIAAIYILMVK